MSQAGPGSFPQNLPFELSKDGEQTSHGSAGRRGQVQCLSQRYETHPKMLEFLEGRQQICYRPTPAIQPPHQNQINLPPAGGLQQFLAASRFAAPEWTSRTCRATVPPRRAAYSRNARFRIASVCWSLVETRAYNPARNIFAGLRDWPKTLPDFAFWEARFLRIPECYFRMAA